MPGAMQREEWEESRDPLLGPPNHSEPLSTLPVLVHTVLFSETLCELKSMHGWADYVIIRLLHCQLHNILL